MIGRDRVRDTVFIVNFRVDLLLFSINDIYIYMYMFEKENDRLAKNKAEQIPPIRLCIAPSLCSHEIEQKETTQWDEISLSRDFLPLHPIYLIHRWLFSIDFCYCIPYSPVRLQTVSQVFFSSTRFFLRFFFFRFGKFWQSF